MLSPTLSRKTADQMTDSPSLADLNFWLDCLAFMFAIVILFMGYRARKLYKMERATLEHQIKNHNAIRAILDVTDSSLPPGLANKYEPGKVIEKEELPDDAMIISRFDRTFDIDQPRIDLHQLAEYFNLPADIFDQTPGKDNGT